MADVNESTFHEAKKTVVEPLQAIKQSLWSAEFFCS